METYLIHVQYYVTWCLAHGTHKNSRHRRHLSVRLNSPVPAPPADHFSWSRAHYATAVALLCVWNTLRALLRGLYRFVRARASGRNRWFEMTWRNFTLICARSTNCHRARRAIFFALAASISETWLTLYVIWRKSGVLLPNLFDNLFIIFMTRTDRSLTLFFCAQSTPNQWDKTSIVW